MNHRGIIGLAATLFILASGLQAQAPFARVYGGGGEETAIQILETTDGGFVLFGSSYSFTSGSGGAWLVKLDSSGAAQGQRAYSAGAYDPLSSACATADNSGHILVSANAWAPWVLKVDGAGEPLWQRRLGGVVAPGNYLQNFVCPAPDSGCFVIAEAGTSENEDIQIVRLSAEGGVVWQRAYDSGRYDQGLCAAPTAGGGCVVAGRTDLAGASDLALLVFEVDPAGAVLWEKIFTATASRICLVRSIRKAEDEGYILAGGEVILKIGEGGAFEWLRSYAGGELNDTQPTADGGAIAVGRTALDRSDMLVMKIGAAGEIEWQKAFGAAFDEAASAVLQTTSGDLVVAGSSSSFGAGGTDLCVLRVSASGDLGACGFSRSSSLAAAALEGGEAGVALSVRDTDDSAEPAAFESADTSGSSQVYQLCSEKKVLTVSTEEAGIRSVVSAVPGTRIYDAGTIVTISVVSPVYLVGGTGYKFVRWEGDIAGDENPSAVTLNADTTVMAVYDLCASVSPGWGDNPGTSYDNCRGEEETPKDKGNGCFIATAAYRSPLHSAVKLLRDFRDRRLLTNAAGRAFVGAYCRNSPAVARVIAGSPVLRSAVRVLLLPVVAVAFFVLKLGWVPALIILAALSALAFRRVRRRLGLALLPRVLI